MTFKFNKLLYSHNKMQHDFLKKKIIRFYDF